MAAILSRDADPVDALVEATLRRHATDRGRLPLALALAAAVHLALVLWLPLPEVSRTPLAPPPAPDDHPVITPTPLSPPPVEPPPAAQPRADRLLPVRFADQRPDDPVSEPERRDLVAGPVPLEILLPPAEPPPEPAVYPEDTAHLTLPVPLAGRAEPEYPRLARIAGISGRVVLQAVIDGTGAVVSIEVLSASAPDLGFSDAAREAVRGWRYEPGLLRGRPVPVRMRVVVEFTIQ